MESQRVLSGSVTRGSRIVNINVEGEISGSTNNQPYRNTGWTVSTSDQMSMFLRGHCKSNASDVIYRGNKRLGEFFDDTLVTTVGNGSYYFGNQPLKTYLNHDMELRDFGQHQLYTDMDNSPYVEMTDPENPIEILSVHPNDLYLPISMVDFTSQNANDGVIDTFKVRSNIDRSNTDFPFTTKGIRGSLVDEDPFRKSTVIANGFNANDPSVVPFLDAPEFFGSVELPPVFNEDKMKIAPFSDTNNYQEIYFSKEAKRGTAPSSDMISVLQSSVNSGSYDDVRDEIFDFYGRRGADYFGGRTDSIAFGGLLK